MVDDVVSTSHLHVDRISNVSENLKYKVRRARETIFIYFFVKTD